MWEPAKKYQTVAMDSLLFAEGVKPILSTVAIQELAMVAYSQAFYCKV